MRQQLQDFLVSDSLAKKLEFVAQCVEDHNSGLHEFSDEDLEVLAGIRLALSELGERAGHWRKELHDALIQRARDVAEA